MAKVAHASLDDLFHKNITALLNCELLSVGRQFPGHCIARARSYDIAGSLYEP